ncbi:MAG: hypothetical protein IBJ18_10535 [Phycisphaerales bacterium]|nr:hypothetical protein [Phycisphaerales bacterium]
MLLTLSLIGIAAPALAVVLDLLLTQPPPPANPPASIGGLRLLEPISSLGLLLTTLFVPLTIGSLATLLAFAPARVLALSSSRDPRRKALALAFILTPLFLPSFLAYAGWNALRRPGSFVGDLIAQQSPAFIAVLGKMLGLACMAFWLWPIAALVLASGYSRLHRDQYEAFTLAGAGFFRRRLFVLNLLKPSILWSIGLVGLISLSSAVPLHLAQVQTLTIEIWADLGAQPAREVWPRTVALLVIACVGGFVLLKSLARTLGWSAAAVDHAPPEAPIPISRLDWPLTWVAAACSCMIPLGLFVWGVESPKHISAFFVESGVILLRSVVYAVVVGLGVACIMLLTWSIVGTAPTATFPGSSRRFVRVVIAGVIGAWLAAALVPGVMVGAAWKTLSTALASGHLIGSIGEPLADLLDGPLGLILAHLTRFGALGALFGFALALMEERDLRETRLLLHSGRWATVRAWWRASVMRHWPALIGVMAAAAALSLHEIESAVIMAPAGTVSIAGRMLEHLHYNAEHRLMASGLVVTGCSLILAVAASLGLGAVAGRFSQPRETSRIE